VLGLSHAVEARLCSLGIELREQVAILTSEKEQNLISWTKDRWERDSINKALELQDASKTTELDAVKAKLTRVRNELEAATLRSSTRVTSAGQPSGIQVQPLHGDPVVTKLQLGVNTPYAGMFPVAESEGLTPEVKGCWEEEKAVRGMLLGRLKEEAEAVARGRQVTTTTTTTLT